MAGRFDKLLEKYPKLETIDDIIAERIEAFIAGDKYILAIKELRIATEMDLKPAKEVIDLLRAELKEEKVKSEPLVISEDVAEMIKEFPKWKIVTYIDHPAGQAKDEITDSIIDIEYILIPAVPPSELTELDSGSIDALSEVGFGIGDATGPDFMTIASGLPVTIEFRETGKAVWEDMVNEASSSTAAQAIRKKQNMIAQSIEYYRKFFRKVVEEVCEEVLQVPYNEVFATFSTYNRIAEAIVERGNFDYENNFAMSLFKQAFIESRTLSTKQEEWVKTLGDSSTPITKRGKVVKAAVEATKKGDVKEAVTSYSDHLNNIFNDMNGVRFGRSGEDFYLSLKKQFTSRGTLSSKQIFHLEKMHWNYRKQHKFANEKSDSYTNFKAPAHA